MHMKNNVIYLDFTGKNKSKYKLKLKLKNILKAVKYMFIKPKKTNPDNYYNDTSKKNHVL